MIDGVPSKMKRYNSWELYSKMEFHHHHWRGQVYASTRRLDCSTKCFDFSYDSEVLWNTLSSYAAQNSMDPYKVLDAFVQDYANSLSGEFSNGGWDQYTKIRPTLWQRWRDVEDYLKTGRLTEAIAVLEAEGDPDLEETNWANLAKGIHTVQPAMAQR